MSTPLLGFLSRHALAPSLRFVRGRLAANPDCRALRKWSARFDRPHLKPLPGASTSACTIGGMTATWIDAAGAQQDRVILYLHGGAFIAETPGMHAALAARIGAQACARALMPSYRLAPEHPYPAGLDDCLAAYRFLLDSGCTAADIVVVGDSAGGNLALALLLRARDEGLPLPAGAVALSPLTDGTLGGDSIRRNDGHDAMFAPALFRALQPLYLPDATLLTHPHVSPLFGDLDSLPPILLQVGSTELLLDDSVRFASKCRSATLEVWHGMPHVFPVFDFLPEAVDATRRIGRFARDCCAAAHAGRGAPQASTAVEEAEGAADAEAHAEAGAKLEEVAFDPVPAVPGVRDARLPAVQARITPQAWLYLGLALLAAAAAVSGLVNGQAAAGGVGLLATLLPGSVAAGAQAWLGTAILGVWAIASAVSIGWRRAGTAMLAALLFGVACGLALLLFERER